MQQQSNDETKTHDQQNMEPQRGVEKKGRDIRFRLEQFYNRQRTKKQQFQAQQQEQEMKLQQEQEQEPTQQQQQPLASHFHLYALVEKLANAVETGTRDQNSNAMVTELSSYFNKSQQMLNSVSEALGFKTMYVDWQKRKLEDTEKLLQQRRELIVEYRKSIEDILKI
ncbi:mediator of RNA polymerase II transcription subunit 9-like [Brassica rapa]|nr:mediator of RNA polymerase II transcription subunit 9-like [Brassica rapa]XP_033131707.1 mediator of RNA polymerase II transcription subunit 9-like [Brassica rapa]